MSIDQPVAAPRLSGRLVQALPYILLLGVTVWLWTVAGRIEFPERPGQLGPDFWPRIALGLMGALSLFQIVKLLVSGRAAETGGIGDQLDDEEGEEDAPRRPVLLIAGVALTVLYAVVLGVLGFPLATAAYLVAFMYLGGSRKHLVVWLSSVLGVALVSVLLLKVVYVSLPRGVAPFSSIVDFIVSL